MIEETATTKVAAFEGESAEADATEFASQFAGAEVEHIGVIYRVVHDGTPKTAPASTTTADAARAAALSRKA